MNALSLALRNPGDLTKALDIIARSESLDAAMAALREAGLQPPGADSDVPDFPSFGDFLDRVLGPRGPQPFTSRVEGADVVVEANVAGCGPDDVKVVFRGDNICVKAKPAGVHFDLNLNGLPPASAERIKVTVKHGKLTLRITDLFAEVVIPVTE